MLTDEEREMVNEALWWRECFLVRLEPGSHIPVPGETQYQGRSLLIVLSDG